MTVKTLEYQFIDVILPLWPVSPDGVVIKEW